MHERRHPLLVWVFFSLGLALRDLWLAAHGGGSTPGWLLRAETAAFGVSAVAGLAVLKSPASISGRTAARMLEAATTAAGLVAAVTHVVRLAIYLKGRDRRGPAVISA